MFSEKYVFKKEKENMLDEIISSESERIYSNLKNIVLSEEKIFFICMISSITNNLFDFYIDINRTNNVFYNNINKLDGRLVSQLYILNSIFFIIKYIDSEASYNNNVDLESVVEKTFSTFGFKAKDKKNFAKYKAIYDEDKVSFNLNFVTMFSRKVFFSKDKDAMEFAYINYYLETAFTSFYKYYKETVLEAI